jgi:hypothetical protein
MLKVQELWVFEVLVRKVKRDFRLETSDKRKRISLSSLKSPVSGLKSVTL